MSVQEFHGSFSSGGTGLKERRMEIIDSVTRRGFLTGVGGLTLATVIAACGSSAETTATSAEMRTVTTPLGTYDIPVEPKRVLAVDYRIDLETALALELPVLATTFQAANAWVPAPANLELLSGPVVLEEAVAFEPDLILCLDADNEDYWPSQKLQDNVAPVIPTAYRSSWKDDLRQVGQWLGRGELADKAIADYEAAAADVAERHREAIVGAKVAHIQFIPDDGTFMINTRDRLQPQVLADLGGELFGEERSDEASAAISIENLTDYADVDAFFVQNITPELSLDSMADMPLWRDLPAVRAGRVVESRGNVNYGGIYTAHELLDNWGALFETFR